MKIALISAHSFLRPGGVKRHILGLYKEYKKRGIETKIIVPRRKLEENYGPDVILLGTSFPIEFGGSVADVGISFNPISIETTLSKEKFDVLHFHNFTFPSTLQILLSPFCEKTLNILTFHSNVKGSNFLKTFSGLIYLLNKICQWRIDGIICVAPLILNFFRHYQKPKIVIPNGIDIEEFNPNVPKIKKFPKDKLNILFVGRIDERKGLIYLLKAYKILKKKNQKIRLIIVGKGEKEKECRDFISKNKLSDVFFEGEKEGKEIASYYSTCDIFCSPAIFGESFGIVLLEAMACGKPFVVFANEGYRQLLKGKMAEKFLAKPRHFKELAQKLEVLIKSAKLREIFGKWGREEVKKFAWPKITNDVLNFYETCKDLKRKKSSRKISLNDFLQSWTI